MKGGEVSARAKCISHLDSVSGVYININPNKGEKRNEK
jgi:hypothetical protein